MKRKVVITGLGPVTPIGIGREQYWHSLQEGKSGIKRIEKFPVDNFASQIAGEVGDFNPGDFLAHRDIRRMDRFAQFAIAGSRLAIKDANLKLSKVNKERCAVVLGAGIGGLETFEKQCQALVKGGLAKVSPLFIPMMISNMGSGQVSIALGFQGPSLTVTTACASGTDAVGQALRMIQGGKADLVVTGGSEAAISPLGLAGFCKMKALSTRNSHPEKASRPFDKERDGFVMAEGAGILLLEELEHALGRGGKIYAEVKGYGSTSDAYHITTPEPEGKGAAQAMLQALADAELEPEEIDYINAHGTSTYYNDKSETAAIKKVFAAHASQVAISSTKSMTGHLLGAAGGVELIASCLAVSKNIIHPTINYEYPDPDCDLDYVPNQFRPREVRNAISNSFGFGGHNAVIAISKYE
ncbi:MAG: beta-ketoacyl-ACP synthase II [Firmicutes bacterium]|nr:beta-ketoacyl-ACP synthase II [Bacillota bacterium]